MQERCIALHSKDYKAYNPHCHTHMSGLLYWEIEYLFFDIVK
jgi:hypothetical protein